jgi:hypothetical protein
MPAFLPAPEGGGGGDDASVVHTLEAADLRNTAEDIQALEAGGVPIA